MKKRIRLLTLILLTALLLPLSFSVSYAAEESLTMPPDNRKPWLSTRTDSP